jgi:hypothetical protein
VISGWSFSGAIKISLVRFQPSRVLRLGQFEKFAQGLFGLRNVRFFMEWIPLSEKSTHFVKVPVATWRDLQSEKSQAYALSFSIFTMPLPKKLTQLWKVPVAILRALQ